MLDNTSVNSLITITRMINTILSTLSTSEACNFASNNKNQSQEAVNTGNLDALFVPSFNSTWCLHDGIRRL